MIIAAHSTLRSHPVNDDEVLASYVLPCDARVHLTASLIFAQSVNRADPKSHKSYSRQKHACRTMRTRWKMWIQASELFFSFFSSLGGMIKTRAVTEDARCRVFQGRELGKPRGQVTCLRSGACEECPGLGSRVGRRRGQLHHRARLLRALLSSYSNLRHATSTIPAKDMRNFIKIIYCFSARSQVL